MDSPVVQGDAKFMIVELYAFDAPSVRMRRSVSYCSQMLHLCVCILLKTFITGFVFYHFGIDLNALVWSSLRSGAILQLRNNRSKVYGRDLGHWGGAACIIMTASAPKCEMR